MELKHIARREGRLSSFLREEMAMSAGLMNRLKWQEKLYVNGATAQQIRRAVENAPEYTPGNPEIIDCVDFTDATYRAAAVAKEGDVVLMSPASAAFDQFKNFMERGNYFKKLVKEL